MTNLHTHIAEWLRMSPGCRYTAADLAARFRVKGGERIVREMISELRRLGDPALSRIASDGDGFFWAETWDQAEHTARTLDSRAKIILGVRSGFRRAYGKTNQEELVLW